MKSRAFCFALLSVIAIVASAPAQAQNGSLTRSFVSSAGSDSNPCTITQPCASFARAYIAVGPNGIITALDPGKYGPLPNIFTNLTVNGNGWAAMTAPAQGAGITIIGSGNVTLIGLEIDGADAAYNGIVEYSSGSLTVENCTLQNFVYNSSNPALTGNGILIQPTSGTLNFTISNTTVSNNGQGGVVYSPINNGSPSDNGVIDHVIANGNVGGILIDTTAPIGGTIAITVSNAIASGNSQGIIVIGGSSATTKVSIDNVNASGNAVGVNASGKSQVLLGRSVITGNNVGVINSTTSSTFYTMQNNVILDNDTDGYSSLSTAKSLH